MEHKRIKTQLKRYYHWRYSGPITVFSVMIVMILVWHFITDEIKFFDKFTCPQMIDYYKDEHQRLGLPKYSELTITQQERIENEVRNCVEMGWAPNIGH